MQSATSPTTRRITATVRALRQRHMPSRMDTALMHLMGHQGVTVAGFEGRRLVVTCCLSHSVDEIRWLIRQACMRAGLNGLMFPARRRTSQHQRPKKR